MNIFDTIIIGSGLGGLTAALTLAQAGKKVLVLEQHFLAGVYATNFQRRTPTGERITFDASLHGIGGLLPGGNTRTLLEEIGIYDQLTFLRKQETATLLLPTGEALDIPDDFASYRTFLQQQFPQEATNISNLFAFIQEFATDMDRVYFEGQAPQYYQKLQTQTLHDFLAEYTENTALIEMFSFLWLYYGLPNTELSALYYLLAWISYHIKGTFYIAGGAQALSDVYVREIEKLGGHVLLREQVVACELGDERQTITTKKGNRYQAKKLIFNGAPQPLLQTITNPTPAVQQYQQQLEQLELGISLTQLYIGLDCLPQTVGLTKADYFTHLLDSVTNYEYVKQAQYDKMDLGIVNYNLLDPQLNPDTGMLCITIGDLLTNWPQDRRSSEYKEQKQQVTEILLQRLYEFFPMVEGHVTTLELGTPVTMARYTSNPGGAVYGFAQSTTQAGYLRPYVKTPIPHLYLASSWANPGGGYEGAIMSGATCAKQLLLDEQKTAPATTELMPIDLFMQGMIASFQPQAPFQARYQFQFTDENPYAIEIQGTQARLSQEISTDPDVTITVSYPDWVAISNQTLAGEEALQTGRLQIEGDMSLFFKIPESFGTTAQATPTTGPLVKGSAFLPLALVPWIFYWLTNGNLAIVWYLAIALIWSGALFLVIKPDVMRKPSTLETMTLILFGLLPIIPDDWQFLALNLLFVLTWYATVFIGQSMTAQYSQYEYPLQMRTTALFETINRTLTLIWAVVFTIQTLGIFLIPAPWHYFSYSFIAVGVLASIFYPRYRLNGGKRKKQ